MVFCLIFLSAFSYRLGADTVVYMQEYDETQPLFKIRGNIFELYDGRQPGWILLMTIVKTLGGSFAVVKIICSTWINLVYAYFIRRHTKYIFTLLLLYFFAFYTNSNFEIMRESISIAFFLISIDAFFEKNWKKYYLLFLFAFMFHESAIFMILLPFFSRIDFSKRFVLYASIVVVIAFWNFNLNSLLSGILPYDISALEKLSIYLLSETYGSGEYLFSGTWLLIFISCIIPSFAFYFLFRRQVDNKYALFAIMYILICALMYKMPIFSRFNNYLILIILVLYADFFMMFTKKFFRYCYKPILIIFLLFYCTYKMNYYMGSSHCPDSVMIYSRYYPYSDIFSKTTDKQREYGHRVNLAK